jgi:NitT/TauT family transport system ATP-binding protein
VGLLRVTGLDKRFDQGGDVIHAIDNLSLDIDDGEFVSFVGYSGCGKSTFLHIVGGAGAK